MRKAPLFVILGILVLTQIPLGGSEYGSVSGFATLQQKKVYVTVYYYQGEKEWGQYVLDITVDALPILEDLAGFPYPYGYDITIYPRTNEEMEGWYGFNYGMFGIWLNRDWIPLRAMDYWACTSTIIHENAHFWASRIIYEENWLKEGYAELLTYLTFEELNKKRDAQAQKEEWSLRLEEYKDYDFPLDEWGDTSAWDEKSGLAYAKAALFCLGIYERYGLTTIQDVNRTLYDNGYTADSLEYMELLEESTGEDQKEFFIGWIFPEDLVAEKWRKAEENVEELRELIDRSETYITETYGFYVHIRSRVQEAERFLKNLECEKALRIATEEMKRINKIMSEFENRAQEYFEAEEYYNAKGILFEKTIPRNELVSAKSYLVSFEYDRLDERLKKFYEEMKTLEEYYPELETKYNEVVAEKYVSLDSVCTLVSQGKYEEAVPRLDSIRAIVQEYELDVIVEYTSLEKVTTLVSQEEYEEAITELDLIRTIIETYELTAKELENVDVYTTLGMSVLDKDVEDFENDLNSAQEEMKNGTFESASSTLTQLSEELSQARTYGMAIVAGSLMGSILILSLVVMKLRKKGEKVEEEMKKSN